VRQFKARAAANALHAWLIAHRQKVPPRSATAKAMDYSLGRWPALVRYVDDGDLPADNN
jgi:transposase